ncbi:MAG: hypothetical protein RIC55_21690 [Pirellulaceae bacterium]
MLFLHRLGFSSTRLETGISHGDIETSRRKPRLGGISFFAIHSIGGAPG